METGAELELPEELEPPEDPVLGVVTTAGGGLALLLIAVWLRAARA